MLTMDVFKGSAFSAISMTAAVDKLGYVPSFLDKIGLFDPVPVRTTDIYVEIRGNSPALIQTDQRGAPPKERGGETREARSFKTVRLAQSSTLHAHELQNIRAFGNETELQNLMAEIARKQFLMRRDLELTMENLRLTCAQGLVKDADGSTIVDWEAALGQTIPAEIDFDLDNASPSSGVVRKKCTEVVRSVTTKLQGLGGGSHRVIGLAGNTFWDDLTAHKEVRETYLNQAAASDLRGGNAFGSLDYGDITFYNYRGTDDGTTVGVNTDKCKFFPVGAGIFQMAYSPGERFEFVNTLGKTLYASMVLDQDRNSWAKPELHSYPLPVCTMPQALHRARRT